MTRFKASILMPVHSTRFLFETLSSLEKAFSNDCEWQLVIVLDRVPLQEIQGRTPNFGSNVSLTILESSQPGIVSALNLGLNKCDSDFVARIDEDDLVTPNRFLSQVDFLERNPACVVVGSALTLIDQKGRKIGNVRYPLRDKALKDKIFLYSPVAHPASMFRLSEVKQLGGYRLNLPEDWDLWIRLSKVGEIRNLPESLISYRQHDNQLSRTKMYKLWRSRRMLLLAEFLSAQEFSSIISKVSESDSELKSAVLELARINIDASGIYKVITKQESFEKLSGSKSKNKLVRFFQLIKVVTLYPSQSFRSILLKTLALK